MPQNTLIRLEVRSVVEGFGQSICCQTMQFRVGDPGWTWLRIIRFVCLFEEEKKKKIDVSIEISKYGMWGVAEEGCVQGNVRLTRCTRTETPRS